MIFRRGTSPARNANGGTPAPVIIHSTSTAATKSPTRTSTSGRRIVSQARASEFGGRLMPAVRLVRVRRGRKEEDTGGKFQAPKNPKRRSYVGSLVFWFFGSLAIELVIAFSAAQRPSVPPRRPSRCPAPRDAGRCRPCEAARC